VSFQAAGAEQPGDPFGALVRGPGTFARGADAGPLAGTSFVAKDLFDVAGLPTGAGSPDWEATHPVPTHTAPAVARLVAAGATLRGKAHTDELAFSLSGSDSRMGAPRNPACPDRLPGGSSSGSAVAVASGLVDFSLGTDTGGSVRLPASYCGVAGLRSTHGRIARDGLVALAPSFDVVGVFAREVATLARAVTVLLDGEPAPWEPGELLVATDAFAEAGDATTVALEPMVAAAARRLGTGPPRAVALAPGPDDLEAHRAAYAVLQGAEAWATHGEWIGRVRPALGAAVAQRFAAGAAVTDEQRAAAGALRERVRAGLASLLGSRGVLCLPAAEGPPPPRELAPDAVAPLRARNLRLLATAGLAGAPTLVIPAARIGGCPLGLALLGPPGSDEALLRLGAQLAP